MTRRRTRPAVVSAALALLEACSSEPAGWDAREPIDATTTDTRVADETTADAPSTDVGQSDTATDGGLTPDTACVALTIEARSSPVNLLFLLDRSGSMADNGKWTALVTAMHELVGSLAMTAPDTRVALTFFPAAAAPDSEASYRAAVVDLQPIVDNRSRLEATLDSTSPDGNTPLACAIPGSEGAMGYLPTHAIDGPRNVILITDGDPTDECSGAMCSVFDVTCLTMAGMVAQTRVEETAATAYAMTPPIRTFVVGTMDANASFLSQVASNGGTPIHSGCDATSSCHYSLGSSTFSTDLQRALAEIRVRSASCAFSITADLSSSDPNSARVTFVPSAGSPTDVARDPMRVDGWDWSSDMHTVEFFGSACDLVRNDGGSHVQVLFACR